MYRALDRTTGVLVALKMFDCTRQGTDDLEMEARVYQIIRDKKDIGGRYRLNIPLAWATLWVLIYVLFAGFSAWSQTHDGRKGMVTWYFPSTLSVSKTPSRFQASCP